MSRLTDYKGHYCFLLCEETRGEEIKAKCNIYNQCLERKVYDKLCHYEDLEEQGRLIELPCKVGDDVYTIPSKVNFDLNVLSKHEENNRVYHQRVINIVIHKDGWYMTGDMDLEYGTGRVFLDVSFGETWFLTKAEAEAKLAELKEGVK